MVGVEPLGSFQAQGIFLEMWFYVGKKDETFLQWLRQVFLFEKKAMEKLLREQLCLCTITHMLK